MSILDKIIAHKQVEIEQNRAAQSIKSLEASSYFERKTVSFSEALRASDLGIIAEIKRQSPSKGIIHANLDVPKVAKGYAAAGAATISVLTDEEFFGGSNKNLLLARAEVGIPLLRKDFIVDEYQILEAKSIGADVILLIAAALTPKQTLELARFANSLGLEVLLEVHNAEELARYPNPYVQVVGVNNRDLKTFTVSIETSERLAEQIPSDFVKISESGISSPQAIKRLQAAGFEGFLIGEHFMRHEDPAAMLADFVQQIHAL